MVKQQMHYLGSCSDKWPMYGCEQFLAKRKKQFPLKWQKKATRLIFRIEASPFFPTYLAVCLVNFHSWEHPQPRYFAARPILKLFFICENFPSLSSSRSECEKSCWMCNCMPSCLLLSLSSHWQTLHPFRLCIHCPFSESGLIQLGICELRGLIHQEVAVNPTTTQRF